MNMKDTITISVDIETESVRNLLITAIHKGTSSYWCKFGLLTKQVLPNKPIKSPWVDYPLYGYGIVNAHLINDDDTVLTLSQATIKRGLKAMAEKYPLHFGNFMRDRWDAETADVFLQCCLLGDLVYG